MFREINAFPIPYKYTRSLYDVIDIAWYHGRYCMVSGIRYRYRVGSALWIIKSATPRGPGRDFIIHDARAYHTTSDIYPDFDWSKVSLP